MCRHCDSILSSCIRPHEEKFCPLLQSAYCSYCCTNGHFMEDCKNHSKPVLFQQKAISSLIPKNLGAKVFLMEDTIMGYQEYCSTYSLEIPTTIEIGRTIVKAHLEKRGMKMIHHLKSNASCTCHIQKNDQCTCMTCCPTKKQKVLTLKK